MKTIFALLIFAASVVAQEKVVGFWIGDHQLDELQTGSYVDPLDYGFRDIMLISYNVSETIGGAKANLYRQWSQFVGNRGKIWIVLHWQAGCLCSLNNPVHPNYDKFAGTIRHFMNWVGSEGYRPFIDENGTEIPGMVCPTWNKFWEWQLTRWKRLSMIARILPNVRGLALDMEHYLTPGYSRYPSKCYCEYCSMIPDQYEHIYQLAKRMQAIPQDIGIINGNGVIPNGDANPTPVPIYLAIAHAMEPYMFVEDTYKRGWMETDNRPGSLGYFRYAYGVHERIWTDNGRFDVKIVPGIWPNRLHFTSDDRRYVNRLPGQLNAFTENVWACYNYSLGGVWAYWTPYTLPVDWNFCPNSCCCRNETCDVTFEDYLRAFDIIEPDNPCVYSRLPNGMLEMAVVKTSSGDFVRTAVAKNVPCSPPAMTSTTDCNH